MYRHNILTSCTVDDLRDATPLPLIVKPLSARSGEPQPQPELISSQPSNWGTF